MVAAEPTTPFHDASAHLRHLLTVARFTIVPTWGQTTVIAALHFCRLTAIPLSQSVHALASDGTHVWAAETGGRRAISDASGRQWREWAPAAPDGEPKDDFIALSVPDADQGRLGRNAARRLRPILVPVHP